MSLSPRSVLERAHAYVRDYDPRFADCFAPDGVLELPFALPGVPRRIVGRAAIRQRLAPAYAAAREAGRRIVAFRDLRMHETADAEVIAVEFELHAVFGDGTPYALPFVQVVRVRDGEIVELRDYFDSLAMATRFGQKAPLSAGRPDAESNATVRPRAVVERLLNGIVEGRWDELAELYAEDAVVAHLFALPHATRHEGREALRRHFGLGPSAPLTLRIRELVVHETADPEVVIAELAYVAASSVTGREHLIPCIFVFRIRDGRIVASRDYGHHVAVAQAVGRMPELLSELAAPGGNGTE